MTQNQSHFKWYILSFKKHQEMFQNLLLVSKSYLLRPSKGKNEIEILKKQQQQQHPRTFSLPLAFITARGFRHGFTE